jgi:site-specific DNA-methyltransferase (adenine-specific)
VKLVAAGNGPTSRIKFCDVKTALTKGGLMESPTLVFDDCFNYFPKIPDKSVDLILCDLPYGTTKNTWDSVLDLEKLWTEYNRIIKDNGTIVLFAQTPFDKVLGVSNIKMLKYEWIWQKDRPTGHLNAKKAPMKAHENILVFYRGHTYYPQTTDGKPYKTVFKTGSSNYGAQRPVMTNNPGFRYPVTILKAKSERGLHPTQKPVGLCKFLIKTYTREGDLVLDNCMGSGTTGVAAIQTKRRFIGIEQDWEYFEIARDRIRTNAKEVAIDKSD